MINTNMGLGICMIIFLCIMVIAAGLFSIFFPQYSSFFYSYNFNKKRFENIDKARSESDLTWRRVKGGIFVLAGLFFLLNSCGVEKYKEQHPIYEESTTHEVTFR
jgi:uncharacterized membrane protein HdeD (DUF308 family)